MSTDPSCDLCGAPAGKQPTTDGGHVFCCTGCLHVWRAIRAARPDLEPGGLREHPLFREALGAGLLSGGQATTPAAEAPTDVAAATARWRQWQGSLSGMMCPSCAWLARSVLTRQRGVHEPRVEFLSDSLSFRYDPLYATPETVAATLARLGFHLYAGTLPPASGGLRDLGIAAFLTGNVMMLSFITYAGLFSALGDAAALWSPWLLVILALPVPVYCGRDILRRGLHGVLAGRPTMHSLLALGGVTAFTASVVNIFRGEPHYYFDAAAVIITLALFGQVVEQRLKRRSGAVLAKLRRQLPVKARGSDGAFCPISRFEVGDEVCIAAGERVPLDGLVTAGGGWVSEALLTGENRPVRKDVGTPLLAGTEVGDGSFRMSVTAPAAATTLQQIVDRVGDGLAQPCRWQRLTDRTAALFFPAIVAVAVLAAVAGAAAAGPSEGILRGVSVLVVACPCAFGLATPVVVLRAFSLLSRRGIVLADFAVLERLPEVTHVFLDKTGTLTQGVFALTDVCSPDGLAADEAIRLCAAAERQAHHPVAAALARAAAERQLTIPPASEAREIPGCGVEARVAGRTVRVGKPAWLAPGGEAPATASGSVGRTRVGWQVGAECRGEFIFDDPLRPEAASIIRDLQTRGLRVSVLSGDAPEATCYVGEAIGVTDARGGLEPRDKVAALAAAAVTLMVGDGVNDAPALAAADVGVAVHSRSLIARDVAAVTFLGAGLAQLPELFGVAATARTVQRQNLTWAFGYNIIAVGIAAAGWLHPVLAAAVMALSSGTILANTLRLRRPPAAATLGQARSAAIHGSA